jgi:hypothetical protein
MPIKKTNSAITVTLDLNKETLRTFRYYSAPDAVVQYLYIARTALPDPPPQSVTLTINYAPTT